MQYHVEKRIIYIGTDIFGEIRSCGYLRHHYMATKQDGIVPFLTLAVALEVHCLLLLLPLLFP